MGFLDHSTNNIIVDAVLTDSGRQALAKNDGSFSIYQFALGDDEVDYNVITQFGRTVGREKVEKNTPILEALTAGSVALKHKLLSCSNEMLAYLPNMTLTLESGNSSGSTIISLNRGNNVTSQDLTIKISNNDNVAIDDELIDGEFRVEINNIFLSIAGKTADVIYTDNIAVYRFPTNTGQGSQQVVATPTIQLNKFDNTTFDTFSIAGGSKVRTFIKVIGINSGLSKTIEVNITKN